MQIPFRCAIWWIGYLILEGPAIAYLPPSSLAAIGRRRNDSHGTKLHSARTTQHDNIANLAIETLEMIRSSGLSLRSRPGYPFSLGCNSWKASGMSGEVEGYSSSPIIKW